jgi:inner membrane protein
MASIGHVAVGLVGGRVLVGRAAPRKRQALAMGCLALLSLAPDADVVAFALGIPYAAEWGHRGASHSLVVALLTALAAFFAAGSLGLSRIRLGLVVGAVVASHGLLDALTDGGLGPALLWPFSQERIFAPVQPLPVAPIALGMFSARGLYVLAVETFVFLPCWLSAFWPARPREP